MATADLKITLSIPDGIDREKLRQSFRNAIADAQGIQNTARDRARSAQRTIQIDAGLYNTLLDVAVLSSSLLEYTERSAAAARPNEFVDLAESLKKLGPLLEGEKGAGRVIDELFGLLRDLEET